MRRRRRRSRVTTVTLNRRGYRSLLSSESSKKRRKKKKAQATHLILFFPFSLISFCHMCPTLLYLFLGLFSLLFLVQLFLIQAPLPPPPLITRISQDLPALGTRWGRVRVIHRHTEIGARALCMHAHRHSFHPNVWLGGSLVVLVQRITSSIPAAC